MDINPEIEACYSQDNVGDLALAEVQALMESEVYLGDTRLLNHHVVAVYNVLLHLIKDSNPKRQENDADANLAPLRLQALTMFLIGCHQQCVLGQLMLLRGHSSESKFHLRQIFEYLFFGIYLFKNDRATLAWLHGAVDATAYLDVFKIHNLLKSLDKLTMFSPEEAAEFKNCLEYYERCCMQVHPSVLATAHKLDWRMNDENPHVQPCLVDKDRKNMLVLEILWQAKAHVQFLKALVAILVRTFDHFDEDLWKLTVGALQENLQTELDRWESPMKAYLVAIPK
jgi:hypothetical protein